jgi:DNA-binding PadR family transcriptional regulator
MSLRHALLGLLAERPLSGYDLTKAFDQSLAHTWSARHSQIYPELARLREAGLIRLVEEGPRGRKEYAITEAGLAEVRRWLSQTTPNRTSRSEEFLRVFFLWLMEPEVARAYVRDQHEYHQAQLARYEGYAATGTPDTAAGWAFRICLEAGIRHERALVEWAAWARTRVGRATSGTEPTSTD